MPQVEQAGTFLISSEIRQTMIDLLLSADEVLRVDPDCAHRYLDRIAEILSPSLTIEAVN